MRGPEKTWLTGSVGRLEALVRRAAEPAAAAVIAHPHPRYGGTMHNPVVFHVDRELHRAAMTTLRFNFRGVGESAGSFADGSGEVEDVAAAVGWLRAAQPGSPLILVGYSFGSLCCLRYATTDLELTAVIAIGLPVRLYDLPELAALSQPLIVVQGSEDSFGSPAAVRAALVAAKSPAELQVLPGAEHLFHGRAREVGEVVTRAARQLLKKT